MDPTELGFTEAIIYRAGQIAPPGEYARVDRPGVVVTLTKIERLPPSFDGTVALYTRIVRVAGPITR